MKTGALITVALGLISASAAPAQQLQITAGLLSTKRALPLKEVAARVGMTRPDVFARVFPEWYGMTPSEFRRSRRYVRGRP
jgi:AraC-like DNA-binding protein